MDRTMTMRVSRSARATHPFSFLSLLPFLLPLPCMIPCCECVCVRRTLAHPFFLLFRHRIPACADIAGAPKFRSPSLYLETSARHVLKDTLLLLSNSLLILAHVSLQTYLDFNAIHISFIRRAGVFESCMTGVLDSGFRKWFLVPLHAIPCIACWVLSIFDIRCLPV
ncbi:hypothetical protein F5888DRAFT_255749 [Russula emetica]|nr:hypothetical protein F5888DRAFT_255749 [Russula emetica]